MMHTRSKLHHAFTLLELVVVIAIISLVSGAGMSMASGALRAADRISTQEKLNTIKIALDSFGKTYGYLPCPAPLAKVPTDTTAPVFGGEYLSATNPRTCNTGSGIETTGTVIKGGVPVRTLGLPDSYAADAWDGKLTYAVTTALTTAPAAPVGTPPNYFTAPGAIIVKSGTIAGGYISPAMRFTRTYATGGGVSLSAGAGTRLTLSPDIGNIVVGTTVYVKGSVYNGVYKVAATSGATIDLNDASGMMAYNATDTGGTIDWLATPSTSTGDAAYIVISHGPDGRGAYPMNTTSIPANKVCNNSTTANSSPAPCTDSTASTCIDIQNCKTGVAPAANPFDNIFFDSTYNDGTTAAEYFDDYVVWGSNALLRNPPIPRYYFNAGSVTTTCPAGVCESWCATCKSNYPTTIIGNVDSSSPPAAITANPVLCKKVITSKASTCEASCFWGGTTAAGYQPCP